MRINLQKRKKYCNSMGHYKNAEAEIKKNNKNSDSAWL
jgi:hypothetical protein